jgi:hypothetical protein
MSKRRIASVAALLVCTSVRLANVAAADATVKLVPTSIELRIGHSKGPFRTADFAERA